MVEDGFLNRYRILWATMRNANSVVQRKILDWVNAGGVLVLLPGALTHDGADDPSCVFDRFRAHGYTLPENVSEFDFIKTDTVTAVSEKRLGKGRVISFPYFGGMNFCAGASRKKGRFRDETIARCGLDELNGTVRYGVPYWMEGDESVRRRIAAVAAGAGAVRQLSLSSGNVDAGVLDNGERAFVGFANYNLSPVRGFVAEIPLKTRYSRVETLDGAEVKVEWDGTVVRCTFDLVDARALLFR